MLDAAEHREILSFLERRTAPQPHLALPYRRKLLTYDTAASEPAVLCDTGFGVGRAPDDTLPDRFPLVVRRHTSISEGRIAILNYNAPAVHLFEIATGTRLGTLPVPSDARPREVLLIGDFVFVCGNELGMCWLGGDQQRWRTISVPSPLLEANRYVDRLGLSGSTLWAIDSEGAHAASYDLRRADFDEQPGVHSLGRATRPALEDFVCNDAFLTVVTRPWSEHRVELEVYRGDFEQLMARYVTGIGHRQFAPLRVGLLGDVLLGACGHDGLTVARLSGKESLIEWDHVLKRRGLEVIDVSCCRSTGRVFAITYESRVGVSHIEVCTRTWEFLDRGQQKQG